MSPPPNPYDAETSSSGEPIATGGVAEGQSPSIDWGTLADRTVHLVGGIAVGLTGSVGPPPTDPENARAFEIGVLIGSIGGLGYDAAVIVSGLGAIGGSGAGGIAGAAPSGGLSLVPAAVGVAEGAALVTAGLAAAAAHVRGAVTALDHIDRMNAGDGDSESPLEFYGPEDAARYALESPDVPPPIRGQSVRSVRRIGDIGPVQNPAVRDGLRRAGYDPNDFRAVQYEVRTENGGSAIVAMFEAEGGVIVGPHLSSAN